MYDSQADKYDSQVTEELLSIDDDGAFEVDNKITIFSSPRSSKKRTTTKGYHTGCYCNEEPIPPRFTSKVINKCLYGLPECDCGALAEGLDLFSKNECCKCNYKDKAVDTQDLELTDHRENYEEMTKGFCKRYKEPFSFSKKGSTENPGNTNQKVDFCCDDGGEVNDLNYENVSLLEQ